MTNGGRLLDDFARPLDADRARAGRMEHQADGVGAGVGRRQAVLDAGDAADLDCRRHTEANSQD